MTKHMSEDERKQQILEAAKLVFVEQGFSTARMEDIARRAGLSKGGVYFHFKSKQELFVALVQQEYVRSMSFLTAVGGGAGAVAAKLEILGRYYPGYLSDHPEDARFFVVMAEVAIRDETVRAQVQQIHQAYLHAIQAVLDGAIRGGELGAVDSAAMAVVLKAIINGLEFSYAIGYIPPIDAVITTAVQTLHRGMGGSTG